MTPADLVAMLEGYRLPTGTEAELNRAVRSLFERRSVAFEPEALLFKGEPVRSADEIPKDDWEQVGPLSLQLIKNRIDFLVGRTGLELKVDGSLQAVTSQLSRYAQADRVDALVLLTTKLRLCRVPPMLNGKPVVVALCSRGIL